MSSTDCDLTTRYGLRMQKETEKQELLAFAARLNQALDDMPDGGVPPKHHGRQMAVAKMFRVGQKAARKWLEGEGYPTLAKCVQIAKRLNVATEWLLTGRGDKRLMDESNSQLVELLNLWWKMPSAVQMELVVYAGYILQKAMAGKLQVGSTTTKDLPGTSKKPH